MSLMDLTGTVDALSTDDLTVTRRGVAAATKGFYGTASTSTVTVRGSVQPATPSDVKSLPEGRRSQRAIVIFTQEALIEPNAPGGTDGDVVTFDGETFEVLQVESWQSAGGYWRSVAVKRGM